MVAFPLVFQLAGLIPTTFFLLLTYVFCTFASTMLCEAMQRIPGNHDFSKRYEFASTMGHYFGRPGEIAGQILVNICLQANNIASIIVAAQVMDDFLIFLFGHTYGVHFVPTYAWLDVTAVNDKIFDGETYVLSLGYVLCCMICIPFGYFNLDENMWFQWFSFLGMLATLAEFFIQFATMPCNFDWVPLWGQHPLEGEAMVLGVISFSCAFVITIPSWVNEKMDNVSINRSVWAASTIGVVIKFVFGWFAAITYRNSKQNANILNVLTSSAPHTTLGLITKISVYLFNIATIIPGIPVYSILTRYNLVTSNLTGNFVANLFGTVLPWSLSMFFYHGTGFSHVVNWSALIFQGFVNFVLPCIIYYKAMLMYPTPQAPYETSAVSITDSFLEREKLTGSTGVPDPKSINGDDDSDMYSSKDNSSFLSTVNFSPDVEDVNAVPAGLRIDPVRLAVFMGIVMTVLSVAAIVMNIVLLALGHNLVG
eukprot:TRINITY_DN4031_c0_g1_i1.p1 TRINITY_DN4031_c0_g1~~TRINITY_DN4031_c0_g1_i1.p1  ORF type:complete len:537 (+),score=66.73 TRINITY_DN4031_c0_g1_i1:170-1612(+)